MNNRFRNLGFGSKRKSSSPNIVAQSNNQNSLSPVQTNGSLATPTGSTASTTSLPMNQAPNGLGRPPSYRPTSPMPPGQHQQTAHHPPPINTGAYPSQQQQHPALAGGGGQPQPPGYGGYGGGGLHGGAPQQPLNQYGGRGGAPVEVEGAGRSKAQLIVGIDFV